MTETREDESSARALERLVLFSDAVIAIAITLLVIDLRLPEAHDVTNRKLLEMLAELAPDFLAFVTSFAIIGLYWIAHHRMFRFIRAYDEGLLLRNLLFLFFVALLPFVSAVLGNYGHLTVAAALYAAAMAAIGLSSVRLMAYAYRKGLTTPDVTPAFARYLNWRGLLVPIMFLTTVPVAFLSPTVAELSWLLMIPAQRMLAARMHVPADRL
jgi:uncharacterized membrane protein